MTRSFPEVTVCVDYYPCGKMAVLSNYFKYSLHIPKIIHEIGTDDVIKLLLEIEFVYILMNELQARVALFGGL
jgi:hypothetical protein